MRRKQSARSKASASASAMKSSSTRPEAGDQQQEGERRSETPSPPPLQKSKKVKRSKKRIETIVTDVGEDPSDLGMEETEERPVAAEAIEAEEGVEDEEDTDTQLSQSQSQSSGKGKGKSKGKQRMPKKNFTLSEEHEKRMVEWLQENDFVWDLKQTKYRNKDLKESRWKDLADELGHTVEHLKGWWAAIRDQWTRFHHPKSGQAATSYTERQKWILESLQFLRRVVRHRGQSVRPVSKFALLFHYFTISIFQH